EDLPYFSWISYRKTLSNETKAKVEILQSLGFRVESTHRIELHRRHPYVVILDEINVIIRQMS
ncbi:18263_t:CDS:2, partial [Funneliformis geosporum]